MRCAKPIRAINLTDTGPRYADRGPAPLMPTTSTQGGGGQRRPTPLAKSTRRHLLAGLLDRAQIGDVAGAEALIRLGLTADAAAQKGPRRRVRPTGE
ncbi:hypothetical protein GCM10011320_09410 [Neoroseomonas lacus]|uniref:Uncharacterized protein n=1 Tax=Neoroseomonas lacus TaxID=287609 RepID=A0A917K878_9PROT|nr:hypothetical protein GCM10011320_09410 [Neoroseomonas lacus]